MSTEKNTTRTPVKQRTPEQLAKAIEKQMARYDWGKQEAIDYLCNYALNRIETLARDAEKRAANAPPKEPKVKKEKPAKTPKEPKAKAKKPAKEPAIVSPLKPETPASNVVPLGGGSYIPRAKKLMESCRSEKDLLQVRENCAKNCVGMEEYTELDKIYSECLAKIDAKKASKKEQPAKAKAPKEEKKKEAPKSAKANKQSALF